MVVTILVGWLCFFLFQQIDLVTADLGRFIENGEQIFSRGWQDVLHTNYYSFTHFQYPFLNHHWGTGVVFYLIIQKAGGFLSLHLFAIFLTITTFLLLFKVAKREAGLVVATLLSLFLIPLMAYRKEIRPEIFSYFFVAVFFHILWAYRNKEISQRWLWLLPLLEIFWVNLHIYFFLGPAIIGAFLLENLILWVKNKKKFLKSILFIGGVVVLATFVNPFGWKGAFHPLNIYGNYGYRVLEEQSVWFLQNLNIHNPVFVLFQISLGLLGLSFLWVFVKKRKDFSLVSFFLMSGFAFMACWSIRNISLFAFIALPILAKNIKILWPNLNVTSLNKKIFVSVLSLIIVFTVCVFYNRSLPMNSSSFGLGLIKKQESAMNFFKDNDLQGPIFNNYDIGGYLIYYLFPQEKVFVDNRPETYSSEFFQDVYIPMQENDEIWNQKSSEYGINAIIFYWHDATPWGQQFLITRVEDDEWAPVFVDDRIIIFLKRNNLNKEVIDKFEIFKDAFRVSQN